MKTYTLDPMDDDTVKKMATQRGVEETVFDTVVRLSEGNPGAVTVVTGLIKRGEFASVHKLDTLGLRGSQIWLAFKDVCGESLGKLTMRLLIDPEKLVEEVKTAR